MTASLGLLDGRAYRHVHLHAHQPLQRSRASRSDTPTSLSAHRLGPHDGDLPTKSLSLPTNFDRMGARHWSAPRRVVDRY
jgi:hypothetical protein